MFKKLLKEKIIPYCFAIIGGVISLYFTLNDISTSFNSIFIIVGLFLLCVTFNAFFIYIIKRKLKYQINGLVAFISAFLFFSSMIFGYKLGWIETFLFPLIIFFALIPCSLFLLKHPKYIVRNIFWSFFLGAFILVFSNSNKLIFSQYCELIRKGQSDIGKCYPKSDYSIKKNILNLKIIHPEITGVEIKLSKRSGENIVGKSKEIFIPKQGDLNNKIEAYPTKITLLPNTNKFTMPFSTISENDDKNYYLGLFEIVNYDKSDSVFGFYKFYKSFRHLESQFINKNIILENTKIKQDGAIDGIYQKGYKTVLSQRYYDSINDLKKLKLKSKDITISSIVTPFMYPEVENRK